MAEPTFTWNINRGTEGVPVWEDISTDTLKWTGPAGIGDAMPAPVAGASWFDNTAAPDDGELWLDAAVDYHIAVSGRNTNINVLQITETGAEPTADPPEFTAYDDLADAQGRVSPTKWPMIGTAGSNNFSSLRAVETTGGAPGAGWTGQAFDAAPGEGACLDGNDTVLTCAAAFAGSDSKLFNLAHCVPNDISTTGEITLVYCLQYTYT